MLDDDEEKFGEIASVIGLMIMVVILGLLLLSATVWVYDTFL